MQSVKVKWDACACVPVNICVYVSEWKSEKILDDRRCVSEMPAVAWIKLDIKCLALTITSSCTDVCIHYCWCFSPCRHRMRARGEPMLPRSASSKCIMYCICIDFVLMYWQSLCLNGPHFTLRVKTNNEWLIFSLWLTFFVLLIALEVFYETS